MLNKNFKKFCLLMSLGFVLTITACDKKDDKTNVNNTTKEITQSNDQESGEEKGIINQDTTDVNNTLNSDTTGIDSGTDDAVTTESTEKDKEQVERVATKEISIYTINEEIDEVEAVTALIPADTEITPEIIVEYVADSLADRLIEVGLDPVITRGDTVIVSFKRNQPPIINVGAGLETAILDAFAQSLVDNLDDYKKVIFRIEGNAYESGHQVFGIDEVYLDGTKTN